jgi:hypothetical protein
VNPQSERDRSIERLLRESLATSPSTPGTGSCLDAEMLAAWVDGGLVGGQLIAAQEHVADCSACQATLAALVRTTPTESAPEPWWRRSLSARWLVPVAATATALAIWVVVPREEFMRPPEQGQTAAREAALPETETTAETTAAPADKSAPEIPSAAPRPVEQSNAALRRERAQQSAAADVREERLDAAPPALQRREAEAKPDAAAPPALESTRERHDTVPAPVGRAAAATPAPAAAPEPVAPAPAPAQADRFSTLQEARTVGLRVTIASPGTAFRWRIGPAGSVEFSTDAGATWESRPTGVDTDLTAGAAPGGTVCWVVGRGGTVLLTTDGRQWRRLRFPVATDLAAVQPIDARSATVTAADGRRFRTVDAGANWEGL